MTMPKTHIRWADVLERKEPSVLPFMRFYREAGLVPERGAGPPSTERRPRDADRRRL